MARVVSLVTVADLAPDAGARRVSVSAHLWAVLDDGRRVLLLDDRGWSEAPITPPSAPPIADPWSVVTVEDVKETARVVVGPDEPVAGETPADVEAAHWSWLAERVRAEGVDADPEALGRLPHDVELGARLRARLAVDPGREPA